MSRRPIQDDPEIIRKELIDLLTNFERTLQREDLREKVLALIPSFHKLNDLGSSLLTTEETASARDRILLYFQKYPQTIITGDELMVIGGIGEWARRVRELRVEFGWSIASGLTIREIVEEGDFPVEEIDVTLMKPEDYILLNEEQDREAAHRWHISKSIRRQKKSVQSKVLQFFQANVGKIVTSEELRYVAKDKTEWARRVRELRTEKGWPVKTRNTGRPDLPIGSYVLEENRQSPEHDRKIPDPVRGAVLRRDNYTCQDCEWTQKMWDRYDPRHLELHHKQHHAKKGGNEEENLITLCTVCHDQRHREEK